MKRYSISVHKDTNLVELAKRHLEKLYCMGFPSNEKGSTPHIHPSSLNWNSAISLCTEGKRGIALPSIDTLKCRIAGPEKLFLISIDYKDQFQTEYVYLIPDDGIATHSLTGSIMPYEFGPHFLNNLNWGDTKRLQYAGIVMSAPNSTIHNDDREQNEESRDTSFTLIGGHMIIGNIVDYLKCFDNNPSNDHIYQIMLCVSQPIPGTRDSWGLSKKNHEETGNPVCVGHTFLVLIEKAPLKVITRNLGFYPSGFVWPYQPTDQGELVNDSYHDYNVSVVYTVKSHEFASILKFVKQGNDKGFLYDLNSNNCTTFALNALAIANIQAPRTIGYWKGGSGCNPGDLGEDLKTIPLKANMQRLTVYQAHGNKGNCIL